MLRSTTHLVGWTLPSAQHCERWGWTAQGFLLCIDAWDLPRPHVTQLGAAVPGHLYSVKHGRTLGGRGCANVMVRSEPERARSSVQRSRRRQICGATRERHLRGRALAIGFQLLGGGGKRFASRVRSHVESDCFRKMERAYPERTNGVPPELRMIATCRKVRQYAKSPST